MVRIEEVGAFEVLDSRGNPTLCATLRLSDGSRGSAIVPSGASTGKREALELRDKDPKRFLGKGVLRACENVNSKISEMLVGVEAYNQSKIDAMMLELDGSDHYASLGANAVLGVSMAYARASASSLHLPLYRYLGGLNASILPAPMLNIINGGSHANNTVDFQEYMIMPLGFESFSQALRASAEIYHHLKSLLSQRGEVTAVGDEGGFAPNLKHNAEPIELILKAIELAGYQAGEQIALAIDVASSEFVGEDGLYHLVGEGKKLHSCELVEYYEKLVAQYPIVSIEDGLSEDDWEGWKVLSARLGDKIQLVGDDLFVTNSKILQQAIEQNIGNSVLIKPNQIGSLSQTMQTVRLAERNQYKCIMSHRSGESEDSFITDFCVGLHCKEIKVGSTARSERIAKYNRLLEIEQELQNPEYAGWGLLK